MKKLSIVLLSILVTNIICFHSNDEVSGLPDFPFSGRMHSGYLNVKDAKKKLHYILIESEKDAENAPLILWLNGGPGCSSLGGFSTEHGPANFVPGTAEWVANPYSWNKKANMMYLESPAGVGFSYIDSDNDSDWDTDDVKSGRENLEALLDFFHRYPQLIKNEFFISGESYAGIYIPFLATNIINYNKVEEHTLKINLKGILIGNGVTDWKVDAEAAMVNFGFTHALYGTELREKYLRNCIDEEINQAECESAKGEIFELISKVNVYSIYDQCFSPDNKLFSSKGKYRYTPWIFNNHKPKTHHMNETLRFLSDQKVRSGPPCVDDVGFNIYYAREDVKKALHVRTDIDFELCSEKISSHYTMDRTKGSFYLYPDLVKSGIRIFKFSGDTDAVVPFNGTEKWIRNLNLPILQKWRSWNMGDPMNIGGYVTKYDGLTFLTVRGAGHMVPSSRPKEAFYVLTQFLNGHDL